MGKKPIKDIGKCVKCGVCWISCPKNAIFKDEQGHYEVDYKFCNGCGICSEECPFKVIEMIKD